MSPIRTAATLIGVAVTVARHPMVRAAVRAAPHLVTPRMRSMAADATLEGGVPRRRRGTEAREARLMLDLKSLIRTIPDYPKPGILFRDITTLIEHPQGFKRACGASPKRIGASASPISSASRRAASSSGRGVAIEMGIGFVPIRKRGKLPGATIGQNYTLEYGVDTIEIHADVLSSVHKVLLIDDLIATGGHGGGGGRAAVVENAGFVIDLFDLGGADKLRALGVKVESLVAFEGH